MEFGVEARLLSITLVLEILASTSLLRMYFGSVLVVDELIVVVGGRQIGIRRVSESLLYFPLTGGLSDLNLVHCLDDVVGNVSDGHS